MSKGHKGAAPPAARPAATAMANGMSGSKEKSKGKQKQRESGINNSNKSNTSNAPKSASVRKDVKGKGKGPASSAASSSKALQVADDDDDEEAQNLPDDELMASLRRHNTAFTSLLSLIPAELYVAPEEDSDGGFEDGMPLPAPGTGANAQQKRKSAVELEEAAAQKRAHLKQAKRAKLDPDNYKTPIELQKERALQRAERSAAQGETRSGLADHDMEEAALDANEMVGTFDMHAGDTDSGSDASIDDGDDAEDSSETPPTSAKASDLTATDGKDTPPTSAPAPANGGILDLRARLQAKIQAMQASRRVLTGGRDSSSGDLDDEDDVSTASTRDELLEERRRKRGEMRDRRRKAAKDRKRAERDGQTGQVAANASKGAGAGAKTTASGNSRAPELFVTPGGPGGHTAGSPLAAGNVVQGDVSFSALEFGEDAHGGKRANKHALPSDPKAALAVLEARKRKAEARQGKAGLSGGDDDTSGADPDSSAAAMAAAKERAERERWSKADAAAQGIKIRDDETLLRKAVKKRDKVKDKSTKAWKERTRNLEQQQAARQKKRNDNIAAKKDRTKVKHQGKGSGSSGSGIKGKGIGGKKMGGGSKAKAGFGAKARPGFEGRRGPLGGGGSGGSGGKKSGGAGKPGGSRGHK